jgi:hypothetical protein
MRTPSAYASTVTTIGPLMAIGFGVRSKLKISGSRGSPVVAVVLPVSGAWLVEPSLSLVTVWIPSLALVVGSASLVVVAPPVVVQASNSAQPTGESHGGGQPVRQVTARRARRRSDVGIRTSAFGQKRA